MLPRLGRYRLLISAQHSTPLRYPSWRLRLGEALRVLSRAGGIEHFSRMESGTPIGWGRALRPPGCPDNKPAAPREACSRFQAECIEPPCTELASRVLSMRAFLPEAKGLLSSVQMHVCAKVHTRMDLLLLLGRELGLKNKAVSS